MRTLGLGLLAAMTMAGSAVAATSTADLTAPIHTFLDAFDKGDIKTAASTHLPDAVIIDEVPPYIWRGPTAFADWAKDLTANDAKLGITEEKVILGNVVRTEHDGSHAYVVMAVVYAFKDHGAPMHEPARMTYTLRKQAGEWKISGWAWTGPKPSKGEAPAPKS